MHCLQEAFRDEEGSTRLIKTQIHCRKAWALP